jgi:hypothetical protein
MAFVCFRASHVIEIRRVFTEVLMNFVWAILIVLKFRRFHT